MTSTFKKALGLSVALSLALAAQAASAKTVLRLAENQPETNPVTVAMHKFADLTKQYTKGDVEIVVYSGAQLGQESETIEQAQAGIVDMARVNTVPLANVTPSVGVFTLPYIFRNWDHKYAVLDGDIGKEVRADMAKVGLVGFDYMDAGSRSFYTREGKPIAKLADLKGLKIRVQKSPISIRMVELLGGVPTPMAYGEVFSSLQTGVIDGAENDYVSFHTSGHYEAAKNYVEDGHLSPPAIVIMNKAKFDSLSKANQDALSKAAREAALFERKAMADANKAAKDTVIAAGVKVSSIDNTPFQAAVQPIYAEFPNLAGLIKRIQAVK